MEGAGCLMLLAIPDWAILFLNVLGIPLSHLLVSKYFLSRPLSLLNPDGFFSHIRNWESSTQIYKKILRVPAWKNKLPDGAKFFAGSFSKQKVSSKSKEFLILFQGESLRGELAHWWTMLIQWGFVIWNPGWAAWVIFAYAVLANMPCILAARWNRMQLSRILK